MKQKKRKLSRRDFLAKSTRSAAAIGMGSLLAQRTALSAKRTIGANDRIRVGVIGSGGQGTSDTHRACLADDNIHCVAVCDLAEFRRARAINSVRAAMKRKGHDDVKVDEHHHYQELLDRKDIDAVVIATPDLWHKEPFVAACEAGKHIYQEKPFSFTIEHGFEMLAAAKKRPELTIQIGTQRRSQSHYAEVKQMIDEGKIGQVGFVRTFDCRNYLSGTDPFTPESVGQGQVDWKTAKIDWALFQQPCEHKVKFEPLRYTAWRWYWDYAGGLVTDVGVHVMDNVHWLLSEPTPKSAVCNGGVYGVKYWQTPDVVNAVWDYGDYSIAFTGNFANGFEGDGFYIYGTKGTVEVHGNHVKIWEEGNRDKPMYEHAGSGIDHPANWVQCLRSGKRPNAPVELGVSSLLPSHLANLAYRRGTKVTWDAAKQAIV